MSDEGADADAGGRGAPSSLELYERRLAEAWSAMEADAGGGGGGGLSRAAALALCDALQLERRGAALVDTLFERGGGGHVSFGQFRGGLLAALGAEGGAPAPASAPASAPATAAASDEDSSGREAAPRLVVGAKRYGRRSRPARAAAPPLPASQLRHDCPLDVPRALQLCQGLRLAAVDRALVERVFEAAPASNTTVGDFFDRLNAELGSMASASAGASAAEEDRRHPAREPLPAAELLDAWERAGVQHPRRLLAELGFDGAAVAAHELEAALERELAALEEPEARALLLRAALVLSQLRAARALHRAGASAAERERLRAALHEAERRARQHAQEADEGQARLEAELADAQRRAEARLADAARAADARLAHEHERARAEAAALRAEAARRKDELEARWRDERARLLAQAQAHEQRAVAAEERARAERARAQAAEEQSACPPLPPPPPPAALAAALDQLREDNLALRDRCDELVAQLEARPPAPEPPPAPPLAACLRDEAAHLQECDSLQSVKPTAEDGGSGTEAERDKLADMVRELEAALEAMREEYERCEEYWGGKLRDERAHHAAEQRAADERLGELAARVADYERQFARAAPLPAIPEAAEDLDRELAAARAQLAAERARLARRDRQLAGARAAMAAAAASAASAAAGGDGARLRLRLRRAEEQARRLGSRLAAADALVADLYVENCLLAAHAPANAPHAHAPLHALPSILV